MESVPAGDPFAERVGDQMLDSPFTTPQTASLEKNLATAHAITGLRFSIYVGALPAGRDSAIALQRKMADPGLSVLIAVDPDQRTLEIVTGPLIVERVDQRACQLASLAMTSRFAIGDIAAGLRDGIFVLAEHARVPATLHTDQPG